LSHSIIFASFSPHSRGYLFLSVRKNSLPIAMINDLSGFFALLVSFQCLWKEF
jgi:hypothetical protein